MKAAQLDYGPPAGARELEAYVAIMMSSLLPPGDPRSAEDVRATFTAGAAEVRVARANGVVVGGLMSVRAGQWFAGKLVPSNAVAGVAIAAEQRGRGVAAHLMRALVSELRDDGVALSALYPSTQTVYRRAGYELGGMHLTYALPTAAIDAPKSEVSVRAMTDADRPRVEQAHRARVRDASGPFDREAYLWNEALLTSKERVFRYVLEDAGTCVGYVVMTHCREPRGNYDVVLKDHVALTRAAAARTMGLVAAHRSMAPEVTFPGAPAEPLLYVLSEQGAATIRHRSDWVLRLVDVPRALAARGYPRQASGELHLDVTDAGVTANEGRWVLRVEGGVAEVRPGGRGELRTDVLGLASLYTGYLSAHELSRLGKLDASSAVLDEAAALLSGAAPWMSDKF